MSLFLWAPYKDVVDSTPMLLPSLDILKRYNTIGTPIIDEIIKLSFESKKLLELRDWLLPMLMNGQVKVN